MKLFAMPALVAIASAQVVVHLVAQAGPDGAMLGQQALRAAGLDLAAWGRPLHYMWPDEECPNIGMYGGGHYSLEQCKDICLRTAACDAINYNAELHTCFTRRCKKYEHPANHNSWLTSGWVGYR